MTVRLIIAAEIAWIMFRVGMFPVETLYGVAVLIIVGYVADLIIWRKDGR